MRRREPRPARCRKERRQRSAAKQSVAEHRDRERREGKKARRSKTPPSCLPACHVHTYLHTLPPSIYIHTYGRHVMACLVLMLISNQQSASRNEPYLPFAHNATYARSGPWPRRDGMGWQGEDVRWSGPGRLRHRGVFLLSFFGFGWVPTPQTARRESLRFLYSCLVVCAGMECLVLLRLAGSWALWLVGWGLDEVLMRCDEVRRASVMCFACESAACAVH
ncbi:hypothetical protein BKA80DRAFT_99802 [Phyllosticta citrichinensis]